jgi:GcrA cell cycle regulator
MSWDNEKEALLKKLWEEGLSCSQIAGRLGGGITRNAVIGKRKRLGIPDRGMDRPRMRRGKPPANAALWNGLQSKGGVAKHAAPQSTPPAPYVESVTTDTPLRTLATLERGECHWPIGDPKTASFGYCGCKAVPGQSYCETHRKRAYTPIAVVKRKPVLVPDSVAAESVRSREGVS